MLALSVTQIMKLQSRLPAYPFGILLIPVIALARGFWEIGFIAVGVFVVLFYFDSVFKRYRKNIEGYEKFMIYSFASGLLMALIVFFYPKQRELLITLWLIIIVPFSIFFINKAKNFNKNQC